MRRDTLSVALPVLDKCVRADGYEMVPGDEFIHQVDDVLPGSAAVMVEKEVMVFEVEDDPQRMVERLDGL